MFEEEYDSQLHRFKESFLLAAAKGGRLEEVSSLLEIGAEVDYVSLTSDDNGSSRDSPLLASVRNGHIEVASLLLAHGANPHQSGDGGNTALHLAAILGDEGLCNLFLGNTFGDGNPSNSNYLLTCTNHVGKTPFDITVERGYFALAEKLKTASMFSIDFTNDGSTLIQQQGESEEANIRILTFRGETSEQDTSPQRYQRYVHSPEQIDDACNDSDENSSWEHGQEDESSVSTCREQDVRGDGSADSISLEHELKMLKGLVETLNAKNMFLVETERITKEMSSNTELALSVLEKKCAFLEKECDEAKNIVSEFLDAKGLGGKTIDELDEIECRLKHALSKVVDQKEQTIKLKLFEEEEKRNCVICQVEAKKMLFMPCRHLCVCRACGERNELVRCPLCRKSITEKILVYS